MSAPWAQKQDDDAHPRFQNAPEIKVSGRNACRALFAARPDDIRRVYVDKDVISDVGDILRWCADKKIAYKIVEKDDLAKLTDTPHHDGLCFLARTLPTLSVGALLDDLRFRPSDAPLVMLENVKNPHNLGAILRVCAHFGVRAVIAVGDTPSLSPAAMRTSEGGAEHVPVVSSSDARALLRALKENDYSVIATSSHTDNGLDTMTLPAKVVVLFGSEGEGLSSRLLQEADARVLIPGSGALESLNVACASSVLLWEVWRRRGVAALPPRSASDDAPRKPPRPAAPKHRR